MMTESGDDSSVARALKKAAIKSGANPDSVSMVENSAARVGEEAALEKLTANDGGVEVDENTEISTKGSVGEELRAAIEAAETRSDFIKAVKAAQAAGLEGAQAAAVLAVAVQKQKEILGKSSQEKTIAVENSFDKGIDLRSRNRDLFFQQILGVRNADDLIAVRANLNQSELSGDPEILDALDEAERAIAERSQFKLEKEIGSVAKQNQHLEDFAENREAARESFNGDDDYETVARHGGGQVAPPAKVPETAETTEPEPPAPAEEGFPSPDYLIDPSDPSVKARGVSEKTASEKRQAANEKNAARNDEVARLLLEDNALDLGTEEGKTRHVELRGKMNELLGEDIAETDPEKTKPAEKEKAEDGKEGAEAEKSELEKNQRLSVINEQLKALRREIIYTENKEDPFAHREIQAKIDALEAEEALLLVPSKIKVEEKDDKGKKDIKDNDPQNDLKQLLEKGVSVVDISELRDEAARTFAEKHITERQNRGGIRGWFGRTYLRVFEEYEKQRLMNQARAQIDASGNIYHDRADGQEEATRRELQSILDKFMDDQGGELLRQREGKKTEGNEEINSQVKEILFSYARGEISREELEQRRQEFVDGISEGNRDIFIQNEMTTDNIIEIADQIRVAVEHGASLDNLDADFKITLGRVRAGFSTEASLGSVDRAVEWMQQHRVTALISPEVAGVALGFMYSVSNFGAQRMARSRFAAISTMGATALFGLGYGAARRNKELKNDLAMHTREMASGEQIEAGSQRRERMNDYVVEMRPAEEFTNRLNELIGRDNLTNEERAELTDLYVDARARVMSGDEHGVDLLSYSDRANIQQERTDLMRALATVSIRLESDQGGVDNFQEILRNAVDARMEGFRGEITNTETAFQRFRVVESLKAGAQAMLIGAVVGGAMHEVVGWASNLGGDDGASLMTLSPGEKLMALIRGEHPRINPAELHSINTGAHSSIKIPEGLDLIKQDDGSFELRNLIDDERIADNIRVGADGLPTGESIAHLKELGIEVGSKAHSVAEETSRQVTMSDKDLIAGKENTGGLFERVYRHVWNDNDTPGVFDKNELRLDLKLNENDDYVYSVARMTSDGSYHNDFSSDAVDALKSGRLKLNISLSEETQRYVNSIVFNEHGEAIIPKDSQIGKMLFENQNGNPVFKGRFAEVAEVLGRQDGVDGEHDLVSMLATHEGQGVSNVTTEVIDKLAEEFHEAVFEVPRETDWALPPVIPIFGRKALEPTEAREFAEKERGYYGYGGEGYGLLPPQKYRERMLSEIQKDKDYDVVENEGKLISEYLAKQDKEYLSELEDMVKDEKPMAENIRSIVTIPSYMEGKNLEKTLRNYASQKNLENFEIAILENHTQGQERDNTMEIIKKMRAEFPDLNITHMYKVFDEKPAIGGVRKNLVDGALKKYMMDALLLRKEKSENKNSLVIISNDADLESISDTYVQDIVGEFDKSPKLDAVAGKWDYPEEAFKQMPLLHASQRLWHYFDIAFRNYCLKSPELIGRNSAFRAGIYAGIGGYNETSQLAEDLEIGWLIKEARKNEPDRIKYMNKAWLVSNPRRAVVKLASGGNLIQQYGDFHVNEDVRNASLEELLAEKKDFNPDEFSKQVQATYDHYFSWRKSKGGWADDKYIEKSFERAMGFLGVKYKVKNDKVTITSLDKLVSGLNKYSGTQEPAPYLTYNAYSGVMTGEEEGADEGEELTEKENPLKDRAAVRKARRDLRVDKSKLSSEELEKIKEDTILEWGMYPEYQVGQVIHAAGEFRTIVSGDYKIKPDGRPTIILRVDPPISETKDSIDLHHKIEGVNED